MNKKLILIAEDEPAYRNILRDSLRKEGYEVSITRNGDELLKGVRKEKPVLIILDLVMPIKNGFEVLLEIKKDAQLKQIKIITLSNLVQDEDMVKAKKLGADDYIIKSDATFYDVIKRIKKVLN